MKKIKFNKPLIFLAILFSSIITLTQVSREIFPTYSLYLNILALIICFGIIFLAFYEAVYIKENYVKVHKEWEIFYKALKNVDDGSEIKLINSSFPDSQILFPLIEDLLITYKKTLSIKVLLLDPAPQKNCVELRFKNRRESSEEERIRIESQISQLEEINRKAEKVNGDQSIEVRVYENMIFGPLLQVGEDRFFIGLYLSNESAITGPLMEINDSEGELFTRMNNHFISLWDTSKKI